MTADLPASSSVERAVAPFGTPRNRWLRDWTWYLLVGIGLMVVGVAGLFMSATETLAASAAFAWLLILCGVAQLGYALTSKHWDGFTLHLVGALLDGFTGFVALTYPSPHGGTYTVVLAALFVACGITRVVGGVWQRFPTWGWWLLDGVATAVFGGVILRHEAGTPVWLVARCIGFSALLRGWSWLLFSFSARKASPRST